MIDNSMNFLLKYADLNVLECDIHTRTEMMTINRVLSCYIMSYHKSGEAKLRIGKNVYPITPGTVVLVPPNVEHDHYKESDEETIFFWSHFTYGIAGVLDVLGLFHFPITFKLKDSTEFEKVFIEYKKSIESSEFLISTILKKAKELELLYLMFEGIMKTQKYPVQAGNKEEEFLCILTELIQNPNKDLTLKELSDKYHLHPTYISNRFKELFGKSPIQAHKELRINKAKELLKTSQMSITDIGASLGFNDTPSFTRLFKSYVGISPSQFRGLNLKLGG
ncbi:AraC family transcriptional regulator [Lederbergia citri]|uniref:Helix-turn-helix domain-containing protein n=1 Tax=Lederbergia citri TaxID=2833580 RepID=A0A942TF59_9BACI|nr:AraC family transcriptional regulator [Lederbergia citri]MBS4195703.1 helix-turn-helix domain-containing protein [Lederbergia citri]